MTPYQQGLGAGMRGCLDGLDLVSLSVCLTLPRHLPTLGLTTADPLCDPVEPGVLSTHYNEGWKAVFGRCQRETEAVDQEFRGTSVQRCSVRKQLSSSELFQVKSPKVQDSVS